MNGLQRILRMGMSCLSAVVLSACSVHELPQPPAERSCLLRLSYQTGFPQQEYVYESRSAEMGNEEQLRYIIRTYPLQENGKPSLDYSKEFVFYRPLSALSGCEFLLDLPDGDYQVMVWNDRMEGGAAVSRFYRADDFSSIRLQGEHAANTDERDAFRGSQTVSIARSIEDLPTDTVEVAMERPLAKFEFITQDLPAFVQKAELLAGVSSQTAKDMDQLDSYKVVFQYVGFMPCAYSLFTDKPVDSQTGVTFESRLTRISDTEASMGFDYVFVNGTESAVTVRIGLYDRAGIQLALTDAIRVPLRRSCHTIMRGEFLLQETNGGVMVNPDYDGEYNILLP